MSLISQIESLLFVSSAPLSIKQLCRATSAKEASIKQALEELDSRYRENKDSGIILIRAGNDYQLNTNPNNAAVVSDWQKSELASDLTPAAMETLTIIAYRGPITRAELEQIRGVNCALILRNLRLRGLAEPIQGSNLSLEQWQVTVDFVRFLGVASVEELPNYQELRTHAIFDTVSHISEEKPE